MGELVFLEVDRGSTDAYMLLRPLTHCARSDMQPGPIHADPTGRNIVEAIGPHPWLINLRQTGVQDWVLILVN